MGPTWANGATLDRIDVNGSYAPGNCRWATSKEQSRNRRHNVMVETPWGHVTLAEAAERSGLSYTVLHARKVRLRWPDDRLLQPTRLMG